jgi:hypothetical protein
MLKKPKSQSVGQTCAFEADSRGSDEVCGGYTGKGSLRAERPPEFEAVLWENPMYGILEGVLETGLWRIYTGTKLETADTGYESLRLLRQCSTRRRDDTSPKGGASCWNQLVISCIKRSEEQRPVVYALQIEIIYVEQNTNTSVLLILSIFGIIKRNNHKLYTSKIENLLIPHDKGIFKLV